MEVQMLTMDPILIFTQLLGFLALAYGLWLSARTLKFQKMEAVKKADIQIEQNDRIIKLLTSINKK